MNLVSSASILRNSDVPSLSTSTSTASSSASSVSSIPTRRIRFAPLPDPNALDDQDTPDLDDKVLDEKPPLIAICPDDHKPRSPVSPCHSTAIPPSKPTTQQLLSHPPVPHAPSWSRPKSLNLLRPFPFKRSSPSPSSSLHSLTPTPSLDSNDSPTPTNATTTSFSRTEEILTLGTINLFRTSSKNHDSTTPSKSDSSSSGGWGFGLTRWSSNNSHAKQSSPLARTQSTQSFSTPKASKTKPRSSSVASTASTRSSSSTTGPSTAPISKSTSLPPVRKGIRMLNGRVYGAKHKHNSNANPFANARDEDPEFVEWGYGGMGSVRGGRHAGVIGGDDDKERTRWERLQSDGNFAGMNANAKKGVGGVPASVVEGGAGEDGDDDGSGMGWVKRRKEQREREKKEREEKEKAAAAEAQAATAPTPAADTPTVEASATIPEPPTENAVDVPEPALSEEPESTPIPPETSTPVLEHNLTAVTLPAHLSRHHSHRRVTSRSTSMDNTPTLEAPAMLDAPASAPLPSREEDLSESESESEDSDKAHVADESEDDDDDDDEEEEDGQAEQKRLTALGAGVEKISRHN